MKTGGGQIMFSTRQKTEIADSIQKILRETSHPELPEGEIKFKLHVEGAEDWSWADIRNNEAATFGGPTIAFLHNEFGDTDANNK